MKYACSIDGPESVTGAELKQWQAAAVASAQMLVSMKMADKLSDENLAKHSHELNAI